MELHYKDAILNELARNHNVAQFVSFGADLKQRYSRVLGLEPNHRFPSIREAVQTLLARSPESLVNIRSFEPHQPRSREFIERIAEIDQVVGHLTRLSALGLITIINETIDVADGGVSGVATPETLEFAPDATPRAVEEEGVARLPRALGDQLLETVYGFAPETPTGNNLRLEFSIHPKPRGWLSQHTVLWERERLGSPITPARPTWPNKFSRFLGDKAYGLLMAWLVGLPVPHTTVIGRRFAPFAFGTKTGQREIWLRTAPAEHAPGYFSTVRGWSDPFKLIAEEDPEDRLIASLLSQQAVASAYSGAAITEADGKLRVEGVAGSGAEFMLTGADEKIPREVEAAVDSLNRKAAAIFGPVSFEWVFDGNLAWVVQLHIGRSASQGDVIYPGDPAEWLEISGSESLERLRQAVSLIDPKRTGIVLVGSIGTSSHKGEFLRKAGIPSRLRHPSAA
jgi:hypothetical protein